MVKNKPCQLPSKFYQAQSTMETALLLQGYQKRKAIRNTHLKYPTHGFGPQEVTGADRRCIIIIRLFKQIN